MTRDEEMTYEVRAPVTRELERLKWLLCHGNVYQAVQMMQTIEGDLEVAVATSGDGTARKLLKAVAELHTYITNNAGFIPNYGERYRHGERISTGFVESTVHQVISKHGEKTTDTVEQAGCASPAADSHTRAERRVGRDISYLVSGVPGSRHAPGRRSRLTGRCGVCTSLVVRYPLFMRANFPVCAAPLEAVVVECLEHAVLPNTSISLHSPTTRDGDSPLLCAHHQGVRTFFSFWDQCSVVLRAPGILTLSAEPSTVAQFLRVCRWLKWAY